MPAMNWLLLCHKSYFGIVYNFIVISSSNSNCTDFQIIVSKTPYVNISAIERLYIMFAKIISGYLWKIIFQILFENRKFLFEIHYLSLIYSYKFVNYPLN